MCTLTIFHDKRPKKREKADLAPGLRDLGGSGHVWQVSGQSGLFPGALCSRRHPRGHSRQAGGRRGQAGGSVPATTGSGKTSSSTWLRPHLSGLYWLQDNVLFSFVFFAFALSTGLDYAVPDGDCLFLEGLCVFLFGWLPRRSRCGNPETSGRM